MTDVSVGYEGMQSGASQLQQAQENMTEQLGSLRSMIDGLVGGEFRTQLASPRFQESYEEWNTGAQQMMEGLQGMASFLNQAVSGFQELDSNLQQGASGLA
jgi:WXG100 family type VII secretion target